MIKIVPGIDQDCVGYIQQPKVTEFKDGKQVCNASVAIHGEPMKDKTGSTIMDGKYAVKPVIWVKIVAWDEEAEVLKNLSKGTLVVAKDGYYKVTGYYNEDNVLISQLEYHAKKIEVA